MSASAAKRSRFMSARGYVHAEVQVSVCDMVSCLWDRSAAFKVERRGELTWLTADLAHTGPADRTEPSAYPPDQTVDWLTCRTA